MTEVRLLYFDGCPHWQVADERLRAAIGERTDVKLRYETVTTVDDAERLGFLGSPTILVDGHDPFADPGRAPGLTCRIFQTPDGPGGSPTVDQLRAALTASA